ncbi:hypothetical protein SAMD00019534_088620 [Acytostelium subglobosum LB1]|uniref:hypothetical protein n=1 Tax=Acytostelium subglobosum LB1 TaxID=1410327 RepID=UPI000644E795|nr:hypothetical protein SAMD00019534_088620 [Acytostelium subglobosum LB1]GAM25687.1 hypothetical protein SAMD00019534_088620 [Acytostelium subglobosum LB1]|eukprot:XP_012751205.1 hypothetical protein SAMD00019534_088620 [Acytostelium subglobosum LB1]
MTTTQQQQHNDNDNKQIEEEEEGQCSSGDDDADTLLPITPEDNNINNNNNNNTSMDMIDDSLFNGDEDDYEHQQMTKKIRSLNTEIQELRQRIAMLERKLSTKKIRFDDRLPWFAINHSLFDDSKRLMMLEDYIVQFFKTNASSSRALASQTHNNLVYYYNENLTIKRDCVPELQRVGTSIPYNFERLPQYTVDRQSLYEDDNATGDKKDKKDTRSCFNCSEAHTLSECPYYKDYRRIRANRQEFLDSRPVMSRYFVDGENKAAAIAAAAATVNNNDGESGQSSTSSNKDTSSQQHQHDETDTGNRNGNGTDTGKGTDNDKDNGTTAQSSPSIDDKQTVSTFDIIKKNIATTTTSASGGGFDDRHIEDNMDFVRIESNKEGGDEDDPNRPYSPSQSFNDGSSSSRHPNNNILLSHDYQQKVSNSINTFIQARQQPHQSAAAYPHGQYQHQQQQYYGYGYQYPPAPQPPSDYYQSHHYHPYPQYQQQQHQQYYYGQESSWQPPPPPPHVRSPPQYSVSSKSNVVVPPPPPPPSAQPQQQPPPTQPVKSIIGGDVCEMEIEDEDGQIS